MYSLLANWFESTTLSWHFGTTNLSILHSSLFSFVNLMHESLRVELSNWNIVSFSRGSVIWLLWQVWSAHVPSLRIFTRLTVCEPCHALDNSSLDLCEHIQKQWCGSLCSWYFCWLKFAQIPLVRMPCVAVYYWDTHMDQPFFPPHLLPTVSTYLFVHNRYFLL